MDYIFTATQLLEKHKEFNIPTYKAFVEYVKAFDRVNKNLLFQIMLRKGYPELL